MAAGKQLTKLRFGSSGVKEKEIMAREKVKVATLEYKDVFKQMEV